MLKEAVRRLLLLVAPVVAPLHLLRSLELADSLRLSFGELSLEVSASTISSLYLTKEQRNTFVVLAT